VISGSEAEVDADLTTLKYTAQSFGNDEVAIAVDDGRGGGVDPHAHGAFDVSVNAPPVTRVPGSLFAQSGASTLISGISITDADAGANAQFTVTLSDAFGHLTASQTPPAEAERSRAAAPGSW